MSSQTNHHRSYTLSREQIPPVVIEELDEIERINLKEKIKKELVRQNAVIVSHYYTDADLQLLADETGGCVSDSLDMARFGHESKAKTLNTNSNIKATKKDVFQVCLNFIPFFA